MGQVNLLMDSSEPGKTHSGWFALLPRPTMGRQLPAANLGTMRIKINYSLDYIHPRSSYLPLINLLTSSFEIEVMCVYVHIYIYI